MPSARQEDLNCLSRGDSSFSKQRVNHMHPSSQRQGPLLPGSCIGITLSSVRVSFSKLNVYLQFSKKQVFLTLLKQHIRKAYPVLMPFLLTHVGDGGKPFLCFYDIEKAFDSVELPILLKQLHQIGMNGKLIFNNWGKFL